MPENRQNVHSRFRYISKYAASDTAFTWIWNIYWKFEILSAKEGSLPPSWRLTRGLLTVTIVVGVGGADGIDPCRNITVRAGGCGIAGGIVPRRNIVFRNVILRFGPVLPLLTYLIHLVF